MFHSTPLAVPRRLSFDPASAHLSFNRSQSSLPPLDLGEGDARPILSVSIPIQAGTPSIAGPVTLPSMLVSALNLTADHTKLIFNLACEGRHVKEQVAREFTRLSSEEVLFCTQAHSTGHESLASEHPDRFSMYYAILRSDRESSEAKDKAMEEILNKVQVRHGYKQMRLYSSTYWIMRVS